MTDTDFSQSRLDTTRGNFRGVCYQLFVGKGWEEGVQSCVCLTG